MNSDRSTSDGSQYVGSLQWRAWRRAIDLDEYETRWDRMAAEGGHPHGEVDLVMRYAPRTALDAGCGFGRVAAELVARGVEAMGVDLDPDMIDRARRRAPEIEWQVADLSDLDLGRTFDLVVAAGNVIGFVEPPRRADAVVGLARHVAPGGHLIIGNQRRADWPDGDDVDGWLRGTGLVLAERFANWDGDPFVDGDYMVTVHRRAQRSS